MAEVDRIRKMQKLLKMAKIQIFDFYENAFYESEIKIYEIFKVSSYN
jgi:hypothetical protein